MVVLILFPLIMFEGRKPKSYDRLLTLSEAERTEAGKELLGSLRALPEEAGRALYKEQFQKVRGLSTKVAIGYRAKNDFKCALPPGMVGIRSIIEPGREIKEYQVVTKELEATVTDIDYDWANALLKDGGRLTFPPLFAADPSDIADAKDKLDKIVSELLSKIGN